MAEFGIKATELSAPQGAGSAPLSPVTANPGGAGLETIGNALNIFAKGLDIDRKQQAEAQKNGVVRAYVNKQQNINEAIRTGQMNPSEGKSRSRALFGEYAAGFSEYIGDIEAAAKALRGNTELGDVEDSVKSDDALFNQARTAAQGAGYSFLPGMNREQQQSQIDAHQSSIKADAEMGKFYKAQEYKRSQGTYDQGIADRERKELGFKLINEIASTNFDASFQVVKSLSQEVKKGSMAFDDAKLMWSQKVGTIEAQLQAAAGMNPELAAPYRSLFNQLSTLGTQLLDPKNQNEQLENQVNILLNQAKLVALAQPGVKTIVATSQLLGANAELALRASPVVAAAISNLLTTPVDSAAPKTQVIGDPSIEKDTFNIIRNSISKLNNGAYQDNQVAATEAKNVVDNMLQQVGDALGKRGTSPQYLKESASFFASPEFGKYASSNQMDIESLDAAKKSFQLMYQPAVIQGVDKAIERVITTNTGLVPNRAQSGAKLEGKSEQFDPSKVKVVFNGTSVSFQLENPSNNPVVARAERDVLTQLRTSQQALAQLIHMGAHLEGTTNYAKFWEANKSVLLPRFFAAEPSAQSEAPVLKFGKESDLKATAAFSPEELKPDTPANTQRRKAQDIIALRRELDRKDLTGEMKAILQRELDKLEK